MRNIIILFLSLFTWQLIAQSNSNSDIQTLEKLYNLHNKEIAENTAAKEKIYKYYFETNEKIRENRSKMNNSDYLALDNYQRQLWNEITNRYKLYTNAKDFLSQELHSLNNYRDNVLNKLSDFIINKKVSKENYVDSKAELQFYKNELEKFIVDNKKLSEQAEFLKNTNSELISTLEFMTKQMETASGNITKLKELMKLNDEKLIQLEELLKTKDSITNKYIEELKLKK